MAFIYCITNIINGKKYIGKTLKSVEKRFKEHLEDYKRNRCEKRPLYDAIKKYGKENFKVEILLECDENILSEKEQEFILKYDTYNNGYNATMGGDGTILYDYKKIINVYKNTKSVKQTAFIFNCCPETVRDILKRNNIEIVKAFPKICKTPVPVIQFKDEIPINVFNSIAEASHWLVDNGFAKTYNGGVRQKISLCASGKMEKAYTFRWKYQKLQL